MGRSPTRRGGGSDGQGGAGISLPPPIFVTLAWMLCGRLCVLPIAGKGQRDTNEERKSKPESERGRPRGRLLLQAYSQQAAAQPCVFPPLTLAKPRGHHPDRAQSSAHHHLCSRQMNEGVGYSHAAQDTPSIDRNNELKKIYKWIRPSASHTPNPPTWLIELQSNPIHRHLPCFAFSRCPVRHCT